MELWDGLRFGFRSEPDLGLLQINKSLALAAPSAWRTHGNPIDYLKQLVIAGRESRVANYIFVFLESLAKSL